MKENKPSKKELKQRILGLEVANQFLLSQLTEYHDAEGKDQCEDCEEADIITPQFTITGNKMCCGTSCSVDIKFNDPEDTPSSVLIGLEHAREAIRKHQHHIAENWIDSLNDSDKVVKHMLRHGPDGCGDEISKQTP